MLHNGFQETGLREIW